jgi:hypothetical protein
MSSSDSEDQEDLEEDELEYLKEVGNIQES